MSLNACSVVLIIFCVAWVTISQSCSWTVTHDGAIKTLDLTPLQGLMLNTTDVSSHYYSFTPCENGVLCRGESVMTCQVTPDGRENIIGRWDTSISPAFADLGWGPQWWTFEYNNGDTDCGQPARNWVPTFECNESEKYVLGQVVERSGSCYYQITIETMFACDNYTTTTPVPVDDCKYVYGNHTLDLTSLRGELLSVPLNKTESEYFMFTPCQNTAKCTRQSISAMAYIFDFDTSKCLGAVAEWDNGQTQPIYLPEAQLWQLTYSNGESCSGILGKPTVFNLEFICDESASSPQILQAQAISECVYEMIIASILAC
eukprot:CAMPEP_0202698586 /NCGR_PEP_ID=MMETSP1385-20130828/11863_1 /ASSEMBLY_ACC=CAM_ASM_000861 /TAXON_ID=933848 /ORGANISM="Elphidium margaritaceum" /LENGTH=316 /DNA_ID=CAMNT_0049355339 /DNA_START=29 /DNA_END=976 /DNA_ORIENTATION=-